MVGFAYASAVWGLVAARVLQGLASALLWLAVNAIVADLSTAEERARSFGQVMQSSNQGAIIGTFIGFVVLMPLGIIAGWQQLFFAYALAGLLAAYFAWRRLPETRPAQVETQPDVLAGLRAVLRSRSLLALLVSGVIAGASEAMLAPIFIIYLQEKFQAGVEVLAWAFLPSALVWTFLPSRMGKLADRFGRKPLMVTALLAAAAVSFLIPRVDSLILLAGLWVLEAVCFTASEPAAQALIGDLTQAGQRGRVYGAFALAGGLGAVIGPLAGGWLYDTTSHSAPFLLNAGAIALSALVLAVFLRKQAR
jgi:MFS family permease